jgi:hypothetical protein
VAQGEEDEGPALFFAVASVYVEAAPASTTMHLVEKKVVPKLDGDGERDAGLWYLDTRATNHMTRCGMSLASSTPASKVRLDLGMGLWSQLRAADPFYSRQRPASTGASEGSTTSRGSRRTS